MKELIYTILTKAGKCLMVTGFILTVLSTILLFTVDNFMLEAFWVPTAFLSVGCLCALFADFSGYFESEESEEL